MMLSFAPSRVRGLKQEKRGKGVANIVRTFTGAWIETMHESTQGEYSLFAPSRVRGLKPAITATPLLKAVRTFTGAWIETDLIIF